MHRALSHLAPVLSWPEGRGATLSPCTASPGTCSPTGPSGRTEWGPCWPLCVNFGRKCLFLVDKFRKGDCSPRTCNFGAEVTFLQRRVAISRKGVFSWPEHRAQSRPSCSAVRFSLCFSPVFHLPAGHPTHGKSLWAAGICSLRSVGLRCTQLPFWALGEDLVPLSTCSSRESGGLG